MNWESLLSARRYSDKSTDVEHDKNRSRFEQDYDRIIFSQPFRKLQDKTQVFPLPEDDFVHTRLTHSLEVSSVGRSLGKNGGQFILDSHPALESQFSIHDIGSIVAAACLAHDLGNPPFGHAGEDGLSSFFSSTESGQFFKEQVTKEEWTDLINFEGNAQGFRILNSPMFGGTEVTFATLGAFTKYPISSSSPKSDDRKSHKKFGFYQSESARFELIASDMGLKVLGPKMWSRHPLTLLVEAADDICYSIIDFEDGCRLGLVSFETYKSLLSEIIGDTFSSQKLDRITSFNEKVGILRAMAISKLVNECSTIFKEKEKDILDGIYDQALTDTIPSSSILQEISKLSVEKIYRSRQVLEREAGGYEVISQLMEKFTFAVNEKLFDTASPRSKTIFQLLPQEYGRLLMDNTHTTYGALRLVTDYISSLTDRYAMRLYRIVKGL